ncbi:MAG: hypothetical protein ACRCT8_14910 [Lacipirellulaceae bacterium]
MENRQPNRKLFQYLSTIFLVLAVLPGMFVLQGRPAKTPAQGMFRIACIAIGSIGLIAVLVYALRSRRDGSESE